MALKAAMSDADATNTWVQPIRAGAIIQTAACPRPGLTS